MLNRISPEKGCLSIPYLSKEKFSNITLQEMDRCFNEPVPNSEYHEDFLGIPQIEKVRKVVNQNFLLRNKFLGQNIEDLPPLSYLKSLQVPFDDHKIRNELQSSIDSMFLKRFLDGNEIFTFEEFQKDFIDSVKGTEQASEKSVEFLTPIIELDVKPDYLKQVVTGYTAKLFDAKLFTDSLSKELKPKRFDLIPTPSFEDYSLEVHQQHLDTLRCLSEEFEFPSSFSTLSWEKVLETQMENFNNLRLEYIFEDPLDPEDSGFGVDLEM
jgi:hypothetical protein